MTVWILLASLLLRAVTGSDFTSIVFPIEPPTQYTVPLPAPTTLHHLTVSAWFIHEPVYIDDTALVSLKRSDGSHGFAIIVTQDLIYLFITGVSSQEKYTFTKPNTMWYHVCATWSGGAYTLYVDGKSVFEGRLVLPENVASSITVHEVQIGTANGYEFVFAGRVSSLNVYSRVLSNDEIMFVSCAKCQACSQSLVLAWNEITEHLASQTTVYNEKSPAYLSPPSDLKVAMETETSFVVSWADIDPSNQFLYYVVEYEYGGSGKIASSTKGSVVIRDVMKDKLYSVRVTTKSRCGVSRRSISTTIKTQPFPEPITGLHIAVVTNSSIKIHWKPHIAEISGYRTVLHPTDDSASQNHKILPPDHSYYTFLELQPNTQYSMKIATYGSNGSGKFSTILAATLPTQMTVTATVDILPLYRIRIFWALSKVVQDEDILYNVQVDKNQFGIRKRLDHNTGDEVAVDGSSISSLDIMTSSTNILISGLVPHSNYTVKVGMCNSRDECDIYCEKIYFNLRHVEKYHYQQFYKSYTSLPDNRIRNIVYEVTLSSRARHSFLIDTVEANSFIGTLSIFAPYGETVKQGELWTMISQSQGDTTDDVGLVSFNLVPTNTTGYCDTEEVKVGGKGLFVWPYVAHNTAVTIPCTNGLEEEQQRSRICTEAGWKDNGVYTQCTYNDDKSGAMYQLIDANITNVEEAKVISKKLADITNSNMTTETVFLTSDVISHIIESSNVASIKYNAEVAENLVDSLSNIQSLSEEEMSGGTKSAAQNIVSNIESYCLDVSTTNITNKSNIINYSSESLKLAVMRRTDDDEDLHISASTEADAKMQHTYGSEVSKKSTKGSIGIKVPKGLVSSNDNILTVLYKDKTMFQEDSHVDSFDIPIISLSINNMDTSHLAKDITFSITLAKKTTNRTRIQCVFWNVTEKAWSSTGLKKVYSGSDTVVCSSSHLTSFSALLLPENDDFILSILSQIGATISITCLFCTIVLLVIVKCVRKCLSTKIHINLSISLFCALSAYMINVNTVLPVAYCKIMACSTHYFFLTTFLWMGAEAVGLYRAVVVVFTRGSNNTFLLLTSLTAWGVPGIAVLALSLFDKNVYKIHDNLGMCWLTMDYMYGTFFCPLVIMILINSIIFARVLWKIIGTKSATGSRGRDGQGMVELRIVFSIMSLLGLTWIFGIVQVSHPHLVVQYMFVLTNTLQGVAIFIFYCLFNPNIRVALTKMAHGQSFNQASYNQSNSYQQKKKMTFKQKTVERISIVKAHIDGNPFAFSFDIPPSSPTTATASGLRKMKRKNWKKLRKGDIKHTFNRQLPSTLDLSTPGALVVKPTETHNTLTSNCPSPAFSSQSNSNSNTSDNTR